MSAETEPSEEQLRAAYEEELSRIDTTDMIAQTAVSLLNIGARRLAGAGEPAPGAAPAPGQDLEQARDAIDAVRALLEILERRIPVAELRPLRDALSRLQMAYAHAVGPTGPAIRQQAPGDGAPQQPPAPAGAGADQQPAPGSATDPSGPGPAESSGRLWVPGR
jgi:Domain of unknown function (DUF1844)